MALFDIRSELPKLYGKLLGEAEEWFVERESLATCSNCAMACSTISDPKKRFSPNTKCCTYHPWIPNYLVGSILSDKDSTNGQNKISDIIQKRVGTFPTGIFAPRDYSALYQRGRELGFGRSEALLCPFYESPAGSCSIWKHRDAVCSTFFCKTISGNAGRAFWESVKTYLSHAERALAIAAVLDLCGSEGAAVIDRTMSRQFESGPLTVEDLDRTVSASTYKESWSKWVGRESTFFQKCFNFVKNLSASEFKSLMGAEGRLKWESLKAKHHEMTGIPPILVKSGAEYPRSPANPACYRISLRTPEIVLDVPQYVIDSFDGSCATADLCARIEERHGFKVGHDMLLLLFHGGVLTAASSIGKC